MGLIFKNYIKYQKGVSVLVFTILVGGVVVEIALAGLFMAYFLNQSGFGAKFSSEALAAARAGIEDGILQIVRNKDYVSSSTLVIGQRTAHIVICKDKISVLLPCDTAVVGLPPGQSKGEVSSLGIAFTKQRKLRAILNIDSLTGEVNVESIQEIQL